MSVHRGPTSSAQCVVTVCRRPRPRPRPRPRVAMARVTGMATTTGRKGRTEGDDGNELEILMIENLLREAEGGGRRDDDDDDEEEEEDDEEDDGEIRVKMEEYANAWERRARVLVGRLRRARGRAARDVRGRLSSSAKDDDDDSAVETAVRASEDILKSFHHRDGVDGGEGASELSSASSSLEGEDVERARRLAELARAWKDARVALKDARAKREAEERDAALSRTEMEVRDALKTSDFARAARGTRAALDVFARRDADAEDAASVRARAEGVATAFRQRIEREARESFVVDRHEKSIGIDAKRFAQSCEHLHFVGPDETRERLRQTSIALVEEFLEPMILAGATETVRVVADESCLRYDTATRATTIDGAEDESAQASLEDALRWLRAKLPNDSVADAIGREAWPRVASACVAAWLSEGTDERAVDRTCAVEAVASSCGFVPPPPDGLASYAGGALGPLEAKALATEMSQAETRRAEVLARARELAMSDDASLVRTAANEHGGERRFGVGLGTGDETGASRRETLFDCAPCTVSAAADALTEHVDRVLESACELGPHAHRASANLAAAAADCLDLFRACVTATRAERLRSIHTSSVVFYNDCHHLANRFCASVYARGPALKRQIGREPALLWPVEPLRALGDATRSDANERALGELHAALDVADGFLRSGEAQVKANIAKSIARARHVIHRAGTVSMYALPHPLGTQDAAELALHYARRVTLEVLSIEDISVEESEALTELLGAAFATDGLVGAKGDTAASRALVDAVGTEWFKARELGLMLSAPLRDITADWEQGRSRALGFTAEELRGLIGALFSETSLRAECLGRIQ